MPTDPTRFHFGRTGFYWLGLALAVASFSIVLLHDAPFLQRLDQGSVPPSWAIGALAIVALVAAEYCGWLATRREKFVLEEKIPAQRVEQAADAVELQVVSARPAAGIYGQPAYLQYGRPAMSRKITEEVRAEMENKGSLPDHISALLQSLDMLEEVHQRLLCRDVPTALLLITDARERIESVFPRDLQRRQTEAPAPTGLSESIHAVVELADPASQRMAG